MPHATPPPAPPEAPAALPARCRLRRLRLFRFRNYADETVDLGADVTVVTGANAQGKTTLLEAVATAALTRSPRAPAADVIAWGAEAARVEAVVERRATTVTIDVRHHRHPGGGVLTTVSVDGHRHPARSVLGLCPVVLFWPEDLLLVKAGPEGRRRLLDVLLSQTDPQAAAELLRYRRLLEQRNALLRQHRGSPTPPAALDTFTAALAASGGAVRAARCRLVTALQPLARAAHAALSDGAEDLRLQYLVEGDTAEPEVTATTAASSLVTVLERHLGEDLARGLTLCGPHRDDLAFLVDSRPARTAASQGQQRTAVLACKLAEVRYLGEATGSTPVLLLDDVLSELDARRRDRLLHAVAGAGCQTLVTTTEGQLPGLPAGVLTQWLSVRAGRVFSPTVGEPR